MGSQDIYLGQIIQILLNIFQIISNIEIYYIAHGKCGYNYYLERIYCNKNVREDFFSVFTSS